MEKNYYIIYIIKIEGSKQSLKHFQDNTLLQKK
jgi:hypothetical protein